MNFRDLEYVIETAKTLNISRAAEICNVSQPSLSTQIKKLESELGSAIFTRTNRQIQLTSFGQNFLTKAKEILSIRNDMMAMATQTNDMADGKIRLGAILTVAPYLFPKISSTITTHAPNIQLSLREATTKSLIRMLVTEDIDAAIVSLPTDNHIFDYHHLVTEHFYVAMAKSHPLASLDQITLSDLDHQEMVLLDEGHCFRKQALDICQSRPIRENEMFKATNLETIRYYIANSQSITLMPDMARQSHDGLVYKQVIDQTMTREIGLIWLKSTPNKNKINSLLKFL